MRLPDYYAVLGVSPEANIDTIQRAYRKKAIENHPDHGGSHSQMVLVNEAWFVLRDSQQREAYDRERTGTSTSSNTEEVRQTANRAHHEAQDYPKSSEKLDQWFDRVTKDFTSAKYGRTKGSFLFESLPTARGSGSAVSFIVIGGVLGGCIGLLICWGVKERLQSFFNFKIVTISIAGGAWLGKIAHQAIAAAMMTSPTEKNQPLKQVITCIRCNQKLLIPRDARGITVTCQKCNTRFDVD